VSAPNYDRIAKAYRWLEYLMLGPLLERTRNYHLGRVTGCRQALILGDGDGRFTARLLEQNAAMRAEAVDVSGTMLELLAKRARASEGRLRTVQMDAREYVPRERPDLVCTHFFLDCFTQVDVDAMIARLAPAVAPGCLWVVSDFRIPGGLMRFPARLYVRGLYFAFRVLTGLRTDRLPDFATPLLRAEFQLVAEHHLLFGLLTTELWKRD
jgi:ubiquinone/menaquinone biosynthesis C-methylase UbiE